VQDLPSLDNLNHFNQTLCAVLCAIIISWLKVSKYH